jgi:hypothetical protein
MKLFNIFKKQKKLTLKELYAPVLDEMWVCTFKFNPWEPENHKVVFKNVPIVKAEADKEGIYVKSSEPYPFDQSSDLRGYIGKITCNLHWTGFFETKEEAEKAYNDLMKKWISVIESKMVGSVDLTKAMK